MAAGDIIKVSGALPAPTEFFFIGGAINSPGQKPYHDGITLTQAILASGGTAANAGDTVRVSRLGTTGRLITEEHNLRKIQSGNIPDPVLQKGDRIEVAPGIVLCLRMTVHGLQPPLSLTGTLTQTEHQQKPAR